MIVHPQKTSTPPLRAAVCLALSLALGGCITLFDVGPTQFDVGERTPVGTFEEMLAPDLTPLQGRTIGIDPGHGGPWPGAVAPSNGLRESDVNLRVALRLAALLESAGAVPVLTRTTDVALVPDSLTRDLEARAEAVRKADVFVSVHHNADPSLDAGRNDLAVFYNLNDDGASLDLARSLTFELARRLRRDAKVKRLLPGNYKVLRSTQIPAVLLESSYMTSADNARLLATERATDVEAGAIAAGLARYFRNCPPVTRGFALDPVDGGRQHRVALQVAAMQPIDMRTIDVRLDGAPAPGQGRWDSPSCLWWTFRDTLANGPHDLWLRARTLRGDAFTYGATITVERPPAYVLVTQRPEGMVRTSHAEVLIEARVLDALGLPAADGTEVALAEPRRVAHTANGTARFYAPARALPDDLDLAAGAIATRVPVVFGGKRYKTVRVVDALTDDPVDGAHIVGRGISGFTTPEGWFSVPEEVPALDVSRAGYRFLDDAVPQGEQTTVALTPWYDGALHGKTVLLDPVGGGSDPAFVGEFGTRASDLNLLAAQWCAAILREAGARVVMTRTGDAEVPNSARVAMAQDPDVAIYVAISFGMSEDAARLLDQDGHARPAPSAFVAHYPGSTNGTRLAKALVREFREITPAIDVTPSVAYVIQQSRCPAVLVVPCDVSNRATELDFSDADAWRTPARLIAKAIVAYFVEGTDQ